MRKELAALSVLFFLAHLLYLPPTLEDVDSVNFALGVRDFDVSRHQPHPPGYPVFIALGKMSTAAFQAARVPNAPSRALGFLSVAAAAALIPLLFALYRRVGDDLPVAWWGMAVTVCCPLFWFTALRPLSDMTGLACAVAAQVCLLSALRQSGPVPARLLLAGSLLCGVAAGVRAQTVMLTIPVLLAVLVWPGTRLSLRDRASAVAAAAIGAVVWTIPLILASGGLGGYLAALGTQAGADFSGVVMLWTTRQARVAAHALLNSFVWPWRDFNFGVGILVIAALGFVRLAWKSPRGLLLLLIAFAPYAVFHLLFHETVTMRYALPLVLPVAFLAAYAAAGLGRIGLSVTAASVIVAALMQAVPATRAYARDGSPAFRLFEEMALAGPRSPAPAAPGDPALDRPAGTVIGMHAVMRRVEEWYHDRHGARVLRAPHGREWLALVEHWRAEPDVPVLFAADPRRTDLALLDPHARTLDGSRRWTLPEVPFVAGTRPGAADAYTMQPPGWMLDRGWALTAEVAGVTAKDALGPHIQPSVAWIRARPGSAELIIGGRHLGPAGSPPARVTVAGDDRPVESWDVAPGFFFRHLALPPGALAGTGYVPLRVTSAAADGSGRQVPIALEQFDVQSEGPVMFGYLDGWQEPEYDPATARSWRWMSERARVWVRPVGRDVVLTITGESPLTYFDHAPKVRVTAAGVELAQFSPVADFAQQVTIPAKALTISGGLIVFESELWFTPAERGGSADQRHLALRIYSMSAR